MLTSFRQQKTIYKLLTLAVLAAALFFVVRVAYGTYLSLPYSRELLEPANVALTETFMQGRSPYTLSSLTWDVPGINYDYPFISSLIAAAVAKIISCRAVTAHLIVSFATIIASGILGAPMVRNNKTTVAPALAALMFMFCHWRFGYVSAAPDDIGLLLLIITLYVATSPKITRKPIICAVLITLCFYTKQYFVFVAVPVFIYMFLYSMKEAFKLFAYTVLINAVVAIVITVYWPLFWMRAFAFTYLGAGKGGGAKLATLIEQLDYLVFSFAALFAVIATAAFLALRKLKKSGRSLSTILKVKENDLFALSVINTIIMTIPLAFLGRNDGAFISYFLQLWMPSVTIVALVSFERMRPESEKRIYTYIHQGAYVLIAALTIYLGFGSLPFHILTPDEIANWQKAYEYTAEYSKEGDIFYSRSLAYDGFLRGNGQWQCGHEGEVSEYTISALESAGISPDYFPYVMDLVDQNVNYRNSLIQKAEDHSYSLITFEPGTDSVLIGEDLCSTYGYTRIDILPLQLGNMSYDVAFYAR